MSEKFVQLYGRLRRQLICELGVADGEDVLHAALERALHYARERTVNSVGGLVMHIARHLVADRHRDARRLLIDSDALEAQTCESTPEQEYAARQTLVQLCAVLDDLPPRVREAFVLCRLHGLTYNQAAAEMAIRPDVVHQYLVEATRACRGAINAGTSNTRP
ncbi:TPA: RNA polymerase sigma factor [Burkholderia cenocepacia]|nr:RNA polymerase sigma factor [Burkholderia cenocepacia]HDR9888548.1 RNA polymerase sigma factor [Burkholderia cenocepacia]